jgi:DNA-binding response OmpR family regulator
MEPNTQKPKILYIEDDITLSGMYTIRMQAEGFEVLQAHDGDTALQAIKTFHPDLVLTDLMMPNLSGYDIIDILRNTVDTANVKIVVMSALSQPEDIEKAKKLGADDFIIKSQVMMEDIIARIRTVLGLPPNPSQGA